MIRYNLGVIAFKNVIISVKICARKALNVWKKFKKLKPYPDLRYWWKLKVFDENRKKIVFYFTLSFKASENQLPSLIIAVKKVWAKQNKWKNHKVLKINIFKTKLKKKYALSYLRNWNHVVKKRIRVLYCLILWKYNNNMQIL